MNGAPGPLAGVFQNIETCVVVCHIDQTLFIHEDITGLNDLRAGLAWIIHFRGRGWHKIAHLFRTERIRDIEDAHTSVLVGREDQFRTLETARTILMQVIRLDRTPRQRLM